MAVIERVGSGRVLKGSAGTLEIRVYSDGTPTDPTVASVAVVDGQGAAVTTGAAAISGLSDGKVTASVDDAQTAEVKTLTATWTLTVGGNSQTFVTQHEVIGDLLFTESELRAFDGGALANGITYTDNAIQQMHELVREAFEQICHCAFGARFKRDYFDGDGCATLWLRDMQAQSILAAAIRTPASTTWVDLTASELSDLLLSPNGRLVRDSLGYWTSGIRNIRVDYTYGYQPAPWEVRRAAMWIARNYLAGSNIPRNALSQVDELGTFQLAVPGQRGSWFGMPEVDRVLADYQARNRIPAVG